MYSQSGLQAVILALLIISSYAATKTCYGPDADYVFGDVPCTNATDSICCPRKTTCLGNGLCSVSDNALVEQLQRGSCTDKTFRSTVCPQYCLYPANPYVLNCSFPDTARYQSFYACAASRYCGNRTGEFFGLGGSNYNATDSQTNQLTRIDPYGSGDARLASSGLQGGAIAGIAIASGILGILLGALVMFLLKSSQDKKLKNKNRLHGPVTLSQISRDNAPLLNAAESPDQVIETHPSELHHQGIQHDRLTGQPNSLQQPYHESHMPAGRVELGGSEGR